MQSDYLKLVVDIVMGKSPIPGNQADPMRFLDLAAKHIETIKAQFGGRPSGIAPLDQLLEAGPQALCLMWNKMCPHALTMCGDKSVGQLLSALETIHAENVPGDFIEAGVWRGGLPIIMRAFLKDKNDTKRKVWLADSFKGLPENSSDPRDKAAHLLLAPILHLAADRSNVEKSFDFFGFRDEQVKFLEGWFSETLKTITDTKFALVRLDGDYYESTRDSLEALYPHLSSGGFLIVDDYNLPLGCKRAVDEYREQNGITEEIIKINEQAVYWRKQ